MKTAYISRAGLRIMIETFPNPDGGITINNHFCSNDQYIVTDNSQTVRGIADDTTEESYHLNIREEIAKRQGRVITYHSTPIN